MGINQLDKQGTEPKKLLKILSRATLQLTKANSQHEAIFRQFGLVRSAEWDLPIASVSLLGLNKKIDNDDCWGFASPVHLFPDRDRLILSKVKENLITIDEAQKLSICFNKYFEAEGLRLLAITSVDWFMKLKDCPKLHTSDLDQVAGRHIEEFLPQGEDGRKFRCLMNEIQMLFHQNNMTSGLNNNKSVVNSLWLSGFGKIPNIYTDYTGVYSDTAVMNGLAKLAGIQCRPVPDDLAVLASIEGNLIVLMPDMLDSELKGDTDRWIHSLNSIASKIGRLFNNPALDRKREIIIDACEGRSFLLTRKMYAYSFYKHTNELKQYIN